MKTFIFFLLTVAAVTPTRITKLELLKEIMNNVDSIPEHQIHQHWVVDALPNKNCTLDNLCKAGKALDAFKAKDLGLELKEWRLPRLLLTYTTLQNKTCTKPANHNEVRLSALLKDIHGCLQEEFALKAHKKVLSLKHYGP